MSLSLVDAIQRDNQRATRRIFFQNRRRAMRLCARRWRQAIQHSQWEAAALNLQQAIYWREESKLFR
jgi:hypothetical protein